MPHFPVLTSDIKENTVFIKDADLVGHLSFSLRLKPGEKIKLIDENYCQHLALVESVSKKEIKAQITKSYKSERLLKHKLYLAQSILKSDAQNLLVSNAVQTGIKGIYPFISDNCTVKYDIACKKIDKWQKISDETFKQCERADRAKIFAIENFCEIFKNFKHKNIVVLAEKNENTNVYDAVSDIDTESDILVVTGPEGGFSDREFDYFKEKKIKLASLGKLIYKAPNAVTAGISNIIFALDIHTKEK